jgi:hypothetical protein
MDLHKHLAATCTRCVLTAIRFLCYVRFAPNNPLLPNVSRVPQLGLDNSGEVLQQQITPSFFFRQKAFRVLTVDSPGSQ